MRERWVVGSQPHIQLEALHELARALAGGGSGARMILERACAAVAHGFAFERVGIVRYVPETSTLLPFAAHGRRATDRGSLPSSLPIDTSGPFARALSPGRPAYSREPGGEAVPAAVAE